MKKTSIAVFFSFFCSLLLLCSPLASAQGSSSNQFFESDLILGSDSQEGQALDRKKTSEHRDITVMSEETLHQSRVLYPCGDNWYNPAYSYCANPETGLICQHNLEPCGDNSCFNPAYSYCANQETGLICPNDLVACGDQACYRPGKCQCHNGNVVCY